MFSRICKLTQHYLHSFPLTNEHVNLTYSENILSECLSYKFSPLATVVALVLPNSRIRVLFTLFWFLAILVADLSTFNLACCCWSDCLGTEMASDWTVKHFTHGAIPYNSIDSIVSIEIILKSLIQQIYRFNKILSNI